MKEDKAKRFLIITTSLSILILLIGTTFSFFSINNQSQFNALAVNAEQIRVNLGMSNLYTGHTLIPLKDELIAKAYDRKCVDDLGRGACLAYSFELFNYSREHEMSGKIDFNITDIENLSYMVLDEKGDIYLDVTHIDSENSTNLSLGESFTMPDGTVFESSKKFTLLIWLTDNNKIQNETDASGYFDATVTFSSVDGGILTGHIEGIESGVEATSLIN